MRFGSVAVAEAEGATAVHSIRQGTLVLRKGTVIGPAEIEALRREGIAEIVVAKLEPGDVGEDEAAAALARALAGPGLSIAGAFTGRANLHAETAGVLTIDRAAVDRLNSVDESVTFATLPALAAVKPGEMVVTVKIIPFGIPDATLRRALAAVGDAPIRVAPFRPLKVAVVS